MRDRWTLSVVLLLGGLPGCGAGVSQADSTAAGLEARAARAEAMRARARVIELEARLGELERRQARPVRACEAAPEPSAATVSSSTAQPSAAPLRSEGDFLAEARVVAPTPAAPATAAPATAAPTPAAPATAAPIPAARPSTRAVAATPAAAPATAVALAAAPEPATPSTEQERLEQLLESLREYAFDPQSGLSRERREALRVLLRRDRKLDLTNPWGGY